MVIYNKVFEKKDGRKLVATGPRSNQTRQKQAQIDAPATIDTLAIEELKKELKNITSKITDRPNVEGYSKDQVNEMINTAIEEVSVELENKYLLEIATLKQSVLDGKDSIKTLTENNYNLQERVDKKDNVILELTAKLSNNYLVTQSTPEDSNRPSITNTIIDPAEKGAEDKMESHVKIKEIKSTSDTGANLNKLKNLMVKLPKN